MPSTMKLKVLLAIASTALFAGAARADVIMDWNAKVDAIATEKQIPPIPHGRALSMLHVAMFEAVNAITGEYEPYIGITAPAGASVDAAEATAAYKVLKALFPNAPDIDQAYADSLAAIPSGLAKTSGIDVGNAAAKAMIDNRTNDGSSPPQTSPVGLPAPGV